MKALSSNQKGRLSFLAKLLFVSALLYFLVQKGFISLSATQDALLQYQLIIPAFIAMCFSVLLCTFRWHWLLQAQDLKLPFKETAKLTLIGNFFNIALPGAVSGDFVKAFYIGKEFHGQRGQAFGSILFDRVIGVSALVLVSSGALLFQIFSNHSTQLFTNLKWVIVGSGVGVFLFYAYLFTVSEKNDPLLRVLQAFSKKFEWLGSLTRVYLGVRYYHHHRGLVLKALFVSCFVHLAAGFACFLFVTALEPLAVSLSSTYVIVPIGLLVTAVPIAPAGVGTGNVAFLYLFHLIGSERGADVYSLYALVTICLGMVGGVVYLKFKGKGSGLQTIEQSL